MSSSDEEQIPVVPKLSKSAFKEQQGVSKSHIQTETPCASTPKSHGRSPFMSDHEKTLMQEPAEPLYTFKELFKSIKRVEGKS